MCFVSSFRSVRTLYLQSDVTFSNETIECQREKTGPDGCIKTQLMAHFGIQTLTFQNVYQCFDVEYSKIKSLTLAGKVLTVVLKDDTVGSTFAEECGKTFEMVFNSQDVIYFEKSVGPMMKLHLGNDSVKVSKM